jgi:hypothetical protein
MLKERVLLANALAVLLAVLTAGCAGGADSEELTKEEYVAEVNAMCEDFSARERAIGEPQTVGDLVEKGPRILAAFEEAIVDKVGTLRAPDEISAQADRLVELAHRQHDVLTQLVDAANQNDLVRVRQLASMNAAVNKDSDAVARELGADACTAAPGREG